MSASSARIPNPESRPPLHERGVAVLVALVVLAIAASLSTAMLWDRNLDVHRTANILHLDQAREYLLGAADWAEQILRRDAQHSQTDSLGENWATQLPALPVQGGALTGELIDLQGLFNVNSLVAANGKTNPEALAQFERLLAVLQINPAIASAVADWIDVDAAPHRPAGAEDGYYAGLEVPYLAANQPLASVSELLLIKGITYPVYQRLLPFVAALPATNLRININTAPWPVIASLAKGITPAEAQSIVAQRGPNGFQSVAQFQSLLAERVTTGAIGLASSYFRLISTAQIGSSSLTMYSLLQRGQTGGVTSIRQTLGTL
ncbi:MAG TPA: type II secretion system minor pseudopilin GspK [Gammaproteobacteria bacterium]|nr:type II secretion system minor pseudopilin GspK [Gammaproteobacteria bacterium]